MKEWVSIQGLTFRAEEPLPFANNIHGGASEP